MEERSTGGLRSRPVRHPSNVGPLRVGGDLLRDLRALAASRPFVVS